MTKIRHKTIICCLLAVALTGNIIYQCVGCNSKSGGAQTEEKEDHLPRLNKLLTNELSSRPETEGMDKDIERYMKRWELRGAQIAVSRNDSLVYAKGFGWADEERGEAMTPGHIMRIASVSKLLTAVGIMKLREQGRLKLSDHVFGADGILNDTLYTNTIRDKRHFDITVEQLLRHEAGFTNYAGDPMFSTRYIMMQNGLKTAPDHRTLLSIVLKRRLGYTPGTATRYCNIGYMLLSMIIEKCSGMSYEAYLQKYVLHPAHCFDFHIAGNYYEDRHPGEVRYYMHSDAEPIEEFNNSGRMVVKCYGENDLPRLQGAGAWVASAAELCRFVAAIDGDDHVPNVLSKESIETMTRNPDDHHFAIGWNRTMNGTPWVRTGTLSGTSSLVMRYPDGQCWVFITNNSTWKGQGQAKDTMALFAKLKAKYGALLKPLKVDFESKG